LQPISVSTSVGLNFALGVAELRLRSGLVRSCSALIHETPTPLASLPPA
jgi:hypothetical protein